MNYTQGEMDWLSGEWATEWHTNVAYANVALDAKGNWRRRWEPGRLCFAKEIEDICGEPLPVTLSESIIIEQPEVVRKEVVRKVKGKNITFQECVWRFEGSGYTPKLNDRPAVAYLLTGQGSDKRIGIVVHGKDRPHNVKVAVLELVDIGWMRGTWSQAYEMTEENEMYEEATIYGTTEWKKVPDHAEPS